MLLLSGTEGTQLEVCLVSQSFLLLHNPLPEPNLHIPILTPLSVCWSVVWKVIKLLKETTSPFFSFNMVAKKPISFL